MIEAPHGNEAFQRRVGQVSIEGQCHPGFQRVGDAFADNFQTHGEVGASLCIHHRGRVVVDLFGGVTAPGSSPWRDDTVGLVFSATKGATATCIHMLEQRGLVGLDDPVSRFWPQFGTSGKQSITLRMILDHTAGIPVLRQPLTSKCLLDHDYMASQLAAAEPFWDPGTRTSYHPLTGGFVLAEIIRRVDGRSLGRFFADEVAGPLRLDFWIGLPATVEARVTPIMLYRSPQGAAPTDFSSAIREAGTVQNLWFHNHGDWQAGGMNTREGRASEIGAAGGVTNARGLAGLYSALLPNGLLGFDSGRITGFAQASSATHVDGTLLQPTRFGPGFMLRMDNRARDRGDSLLIGPRAFGHVGAGGSIGFCDPGVDLALGYMMSRMGSGFLLNDRGQRIVNAAYDCIGKTRYGMEPRY